MLKNNIYLFYPPGYSGTYLKWAIMKSENDCADLTVNDPINYSRDDSLSQFGGHGTAHLHIKSPTHMSLEYMYIWILYNKPLDKRIYPVNSASHGGKLNRGSPAQNIKRLLHADPNGIYINIHHGNDFDVSDYCALNLLTKWPVFYKVVNSYLNFSLPDQIVNSEKYNSQDLRNFYVEHLTPYVPKNAPLDRLEIKKFIDDRNSWYNVRKQYTPQEIIDSEYILFDDIPANVTEISVADIMSDQFIDKLKECLNTYGVEHFNFSYVSDFHKNYIKAQQNLPYVKDIKSYRTLGTVSDFMLSHPFCEAKLILEYQKKNQLPENWQTLKTTDIIS